MTTAHITQQLKTKGFGDTLNITDAVAKAVRHAKITTGIATIFVSGSTAGVTTIEFEPGVVKDFKQALERLIPTDIDYEHNRMGETNGFAHVRSALVKPTLTIPVAEGRPALGTWQQIVFVDFDNTSRDRTYSITVIGE